MTLELQRANRELNLEEFEQRATVLKSRPRFVLVELSQGCNLHCPMCRSQKISPRDRTMSDELIDQVAESLFPTAEMVDIRGWGESLIAPSVMKLIDAVHAAESVVRVVSNLSFSRGPVLERLIEIDARVDVSIDTVDPEVLQEVRPGTRLDLVERNLSTLMAAGGAMARELRLIVTLQKPTLPTLEGLVRWASDHGVSTLAINEVTLAPRHPLGLDGSEPEVDASVRRAAAVAHELGVRLQAGTSLGTAVPAKAGVSTCVHPWTYTAVGYDGSIGFCDHLVGPMMPVAHMGDVTGSTFEEVWNGPFWQRLRAWHVARSAPDSPPSRTCAKCYLHRNTDFEDLFDPTARRVFV